MMMIDSFYRSIVVMLTKNFKGLRARKLGRRPLQGSKLLNGLKIWCLAVNCQATGPNNCVSVAPLLRVFFVFLCFVFLLNWLLKNGRYLIVKFLSIAKDFSTNRKLCGQSYMRNSLNLELLNGIFNIWWY